MFGLLWEWELHGFFALEMKKSQVEKVAALKFAVIYCREKSKKKEDLHSPITTSQNLALFQKMFFFIEYSVYFAFEKILHFEPRWNWISLLGCFSFLNSRKTIFSNFAGFIFANFASSFFWQILLYFNFAIFAVCNFREISRDLYFANFREFSQISRIKPREILATRKFSPSKIKAL